MAPESIELAGSIAGRLCDEALWADGRALWLGDVKEEVAGNWEVVHRSVDGDLYGGTAGIALFLTRLWRVTQEPAFRKTAVGALLHAAEWHRRSRPPGTLYSGSVGVAAALAEGAVAFGSDELARLARSVTLDALERLPKTENDLIAGRSGSILALLALARVLDQAEAIDAARQLGQALACDAHVTPEWGAAWPSDIGADEPALCGLAHGASGPALALGELAALDGNDDLARLAGAAARYERAWYDVEEENWPDLRELTRVGIARGERPAYPMFWCHGAIGIGLARLRRYERTGETTAAAEAGAALQVAEKHLALQADQLRTDLCQCHGLAAFAELFLEGARVLRQDALRQLAQECGELAASACRHEAENVPCGVPDGGENPSLMLGLAGIGMMFLRCADPTVESVGLLYSEPVVSARIIVQLKGPATGEALDRRSRELCEMIPGTRLERFSKHGRVLLRLSDSATTAQAIERFGELEDVEYAEADVVDRAQPS